MGNAHRLSWVGDGPDGWRCAVVFGAATVSSLFLTLALGLGLWVAVPSLVLDWQPTLVTSGSMEPLIAPGDVVLVREVDPGAVAVGSVVLYDLPGTGPVLHRVVGVLDGGSFVTRGDANEVADSAPVDADQIRGGAVLAVPGVGLPSLWLERGDVVAVVLAAAALVGAVALAPRTRDPRFDPWLRDGPGLPGDLVLAPRAPCARATGRLMPTDDLHALLAATDQAVPTPPEDPR